MKLSVVIPAYNEERTLAQVIEAVQSVDLAGPLGTPLERELIVVDDGSTDGTSTLARAYPVTVVRHPDNRGLAAARNTGIKQATAEIVTFLDDDCEPAPDWAEQLVTAYSAYGSARVLAVGGPALPAPGPGFMLGFLARHNPLQPLGMELARSERLLYRLGVYLRSQWAPQPPPPHSACSLR